jgi:hypothetical protein
MDIERQRKLGNSGTSSSLQNPDARFIIAQRKSNMMYNIKTRPLLSGAAQSLCSDKDLFASLSASKLATTSYAPTRSIAPEKSTFGDADIMQQKCSVHRNPRRGLIATEFFEATGAMNGNIRAQAEGFYAGRRPFGGQWGYQAAPRSHPLSGAHFKK